MAAYRAKDREKSQAAKKSFVICLAFILVLFAPIADEVEVIGEDYISKAESAGFAGTLTGSR